jgi:hypothetical protein
MLLALDWPSLAAWAGVASAIIAAGMQVRSATQASKIERVIALHRDLTSGEVSAARLRFGDWMAPCWSA